MAIDYGSPSNHLFSNGPDVMRTVFELCKKRIKHALDPEDLEMYVEQGIDAKGLAWFLCNRGTFGVEAYHKHGNAVIGSQSNTPEVAKGLMELGNNDWNMNRRLKLAGANGISMPVLGHKHWWETSKACLLASSAKISMLCETA
eukprot:2167885-Rhodomonas_salina.1